jgi:hypothetical protein
LVGVAGVGFTIIETMLGVEQLPAVAVIVNVVVCCAVELFVRIPEMVAPVPLVAMPVRFEVLVLAHEKVVPATLFGLEILISVIGVAEHIV